MINVIMVDEEQYKGAEVAAILNAALENMKASHNTEDLNEMSDLNLIGFLVYIAIQKTDDYFIQELISKYCRQLFEKQIITFLRS